MKFKKNISNNIFSKLNYCTCFLTPLLLTLILQFLHNTHMINAVPGSFSMVKSVFQGVAATSFLYFIIHEHFNIHTFLSTAFSISYGICSYSLVQENSIPVLLIYALFPILFLCYLNLLNTKKSIVFIIIFTIFFLLHGPLALIIAFFMFLYAIFCISNLKHSLRFIEATIVSIMISSVRFVPQFIQFVNGSSNQYDLYFSVIPTFASFTRFLFGAMPSVAFFTDYRQDLYFGIFALIATISYFLICKSSFKNKITNFLFLLFIYLCTQSGFFYHMINLKKENHTNAFSFLLVFFALYLGLQAFASIDYSKKKQLFIPATIFTIYMIISFIIGGNYFTKLSIVLNIFILILYMIVFICFFNTKRKTFAPILISVLFVSEIFANAILICNQASIPNYTTHTEKFAYPDSAYNYPSYFASNVDAYFKSNQEVSNNFTFNNEELTSDEQSATADTYFSSSLYQFFDLLPDFSALAADDYKNYGITPYSNFLSKVNAICKKMGAKDDLFIPCDYSFEFQPTEDLEIIPCGNDIYNISHKNPLNYTGDETYNIKIQISCSQDGTFIVYDNLFGVPYQTEIKNNKGEIIIDLPCLTTFKLNDQISGYILNTEIYDGLSDLIVQYNRYLIENTETNYTIYYVALLLTITGLLLLYICFIRKPEFLQFLDQKIINIANNRFIIRIKNFLFENRVYIFAFLIPYVLFCTCLILFSCLPFGSNSIFDEDGFSLTIPISLDVYSNIKAGHALYSFLGGYGFNLYSMSPYAILNIFSTTKTPLEVIGGITMSEAFYIGLSGLTMVFYLTHRTLGNKASKDDWHLLIPACIYALNNYMLCMHSYCYWYQTLAAIPLLLLAMDYLMEKKRYLLYVVVLAFCIYTNLNMSIYLCIYLVIRFFTYHFSDIKDFIFKGIRFSIGSILGGGCSFFIISNTLSGTIDSGYNASDNQLPTIGLHGNFFSQWKQHMIFSEVRAIQWSESYANLYLGIIPLVLLLCYILSKKYSLADKIRTLVPLLFIYLALNGNVLSYFWNGMHYQTGVPNRNAFLICLLEAILAYEAIQILKDLSVKKIIACFIAIGIFLTLCQFIGVGNSNFAYYASLSVLCIYFICYIITYFAKKPQYFTQICIVLLIAELFINMTFSFSQYTLNGIGLLGNIDQIHDDMADITKDGNTLARTNYASGIAQNMGQYFNTPCNNIFNSFVTIHQGVTNMMYGFVSGVNFLTTPQNSIPLCLSMSNTQYIYYSALTTDCVKDLKFYKYIGETSGNYVFENPYALPLGFYVPKEATTIHDYNSYIPNFWENFAKAILPDGPNILDQQLIYYDECGSKKEDSFYYTDENDNILTFSEVTKRLEDTKELGNSIDAMNNLYIHFNITPQADGFMYFSAIGFIGLGDAIKGHSFHVRIAYPESTMPPSNTFLNLVSVDMQKMIPLFNKLSENTLENIQYTGHTLTATTNYKNDGYTMLSIPWERGWSAYIDGKEVEIEDPYKAMMFIKTPAGKHTLTLKFVPYNMIYALIITASFIIFTLLFVIVIYSIRKKHPDFIL